MPDPEGRAIGATFLRNNLGKRSICIDLKRPEGRQLVLDMAPRFDVVAENFRAGAMDRARAWDTRTSSARIRSASMSRFRASATSTTSPYRDRPAFAPIVEAMSGIYK